MCPFVGSASRSGGSEVRQGYTQLLCHTLIPIIAVPFSCASALCLTVCDPLEPVRGREGGPLTGGEDESVTCTVEDVMIAPGDSWVWCACY